MDQPSTRGRLDPVLVGLLGLTAVTVAWYAADLGGTASQVIGIWILFTGLHAGLIVVARPIAKLAATPPAARRFWRALCVTGYVYVAGDLVQLVTAVRDPLAPGAATGGLVQSVCLGLGTGWLALAMLTSPLGIESGRARVRFWLDVATVMVAAAVFGWHFAGVPAAPAGGSLVGVAGSVLVGPVILLVCVFVVVKLLLTGTAPFTRACGLIGAAAGVTEGAAHGFDAMLVSSHRLHWLLALNALANALLIVAARVQQRQLSADPSAADRRSRRPYSLLPYIAVAATYALLVVVEQGVDDGGRNWVVLTGAIASTGLVVVRQIVAFEDNARLLTQLDTKVRELNLAQHGLRRSLDERDALAAQLRHQAFHDSLTGLANRALFTDRLEGALATARRSGGEVVVMLIDLDNFKPVNDQLGHAAGDLVLKEVSARLVSCVRESDTVARLGGDEFAVLICPPHGEDPSAIAERIVAAVSGPAAASGPVVGASVGVAVDTGGSRDPDTLIRDADRAMYAAKNRGKGAYALSPAGAPEWTHLSGV